MPRNDTASGVAAARRAPAVPGPQTIADGATGGRPSATIGWLVLATFVVILNETTMINALPALLGDLGVSTHAGQWLSTAFMLTMATVIPTTGWLLSRLTTRTALATAMSTFCVGTLVCSLAPSLEVLIAGRVVQAAGTAVMIPLTTSAVMALIEPSRRGRVMGRVSMAIAVAPAMGPALSGFVLSFASWRWIFGLVLPVAVAATVIALRKVDDLARPDATRLDVISLGLAASGLCALLYGLSRVGSDGATATLACLSLGLCLMAGFTRRQRRLVVTDRGPLLDLRTLDHPRFVLGLALVGCTFMVMIGTTVLLPIFLQGVLHLDALAAGVTVMPAGVAMALLSPVAGARYDRAGLRPLAVPGVALLALALTALLATSQDTPATAIAACFTVVMVGCAAVFTPTITAALGVLPTRLAPHGSALLSTANQVAAAAGTAVVIGALTWRSEQLGGRGLGPSVALASGVRAASLALLVVALVAVGLAIALTRSPLAARTGAATPTTATNGEES